MSRLFPLKLVRVMLALSFSFWMTGAACLLGCSNASASAVRIESPDASAIAGRSCHSAAHHCCAKKSPPSIDSAIQSLHVSGLEISTEAVMSDCPLSVIGSAVVAKTKVDDKDGNQISVRALPSFEKAVHSEPFCSTPLQSCNRGPTYLRCCVFLI